MFSFLAFCRRTAQESDVGMESDYVRLGDLSKKMTFLCFVNPFSALHAIFSLWQSCCVLESPIWYIFTKPDTNTCKTDNNILLYSSSCAWLFRIKIN